MSGPIGALETIGCLAEVTSVFGSLASWLRSEADVVSVADPVWVSGGHDAEVGPLRVEWYADAEFNDGRAVSFGLELRRHEGEWVVEPGVRITDRQGQDDLVDLPVRYAVDDDELCAELRGAARHVNDVREVALSRFRSC